jgi:hypothetical protein
MREERQLERRRRPALKPTISKYPGMPLWRCRLIQQPWGIFTPVIVGHGPTPREAYFSWRAKIQDL